MHALRPVCSACVYWVVDQTASAATSGHCHRYPPSVIVNHESGNVVQKFPTTDHHQWCGEWSCDDRAMAAAARKAVVRAATDV